jgi:hypothetical protein
MENSSGFATGKHVRRDETGKEIYGGITQIEGKPQYIDEAGNEHLYRFIYNYIDEKGGSADAKL